MRNIFKRQNDNNNETLKIELFGNWDELHEEQLKEEIKKQRTEDLKKWLKVIREGLVIGIGATILGWILAELKERI